MFVFVLGFNFGGPLSSFMYIAICCTEGSLGRIFKEKEQGRS
jgi:hypothetical protein